MSIEIKNKNRVCSCCGEKLTKDSYDAMAWYDVKGTLYCDGCLARKLLGEHGKHYTAVTFTEMEARSYQNDDVICETHEEFLEALENGEFEDDYEFEKEFEDDEDSLYTDVWEYKNRLYDFDDDLQYVDLIETILSDLGYDDEYGLALSDEEYEALDDE